MKGAGLVLFACISLAQPAGAQIASAFAAPLKYSESVRLKVERGVDADVTIEDPVCPVGVPVPGVAVATRNWPGDATLPAIPAMCVNDTFRPGEFHTGVDPSVSAAAVATNGEFKGANMVGSFGSGRACSSINSVGQGC